MDIQVVGSKPRGKPCKTWKDRDTLEEDEIASPRMLKVWRRAMHKGNETTNHIASGKRSLLDDDDNVARRLGGTV